MRNYHFSNNKNIKRLHGHHSTRVYEQNVIWNAHAHVPWQVLQISSFMMLSTQLSEPYNVIRIEENGISISNNLLCWHIGRLVCDVATKSEAVL